MKFFVDENETEAIIPPLKLVLFQHEFRSSAEENLGGAEDINLFTEVESRGFDAIITRDRNQLSNKDERCALVDAGLQWIGHKEPAATGEQLIACLTAGYLVALPHVVHLMTSVQEPHAFHVRNIEWQLGQRVRHRPLRV